MRFTNKPAKFFALKITIQCNTTLTFYVKSTKLANCLINAELCLVFYLKKFINLPL